MMYAPMPGMNGGPAAVPGPLAQYKDPAGLAGFIKALILGGIVLTFGNLYFSWTELNYLQALAKTPAYLSGQSVEVDYQPGGMQLLLILGYVIVILMLLVGFFRWVYRSCKNVHALGAVGLKYTPGWAVGWFFIPFANIVMPYKVMQEIHRASRHPLHWRQLPGSKLILAWWLLGLAGNIFGQSSANAGYGASLEQLCFLQQLTLGGLVADIVVSGLLFLMVTEISDTQQTVFRYLCENPDQHPAALKQSQQAEPLAASPLRPVRQEREAVPLCSTRA